MVTRDPFSPASSIDRFAGSTARNGSKKTKTEMPLINPMAPSSMNRRKNLTRVV